jgi:metal-sulfur cluster biosynthetic enzyme
MSGALLTSHRQVEARIWEALRHVEDPEIPVSVLGLGLIVSVSYSSAARAAELEITFTAMGCPATEFIQDDIREALLRDPEIDDVRMEVVWDPVWTKDRIRADARETMRSFGIAV